MQCVYYVRVKCSMRTCCILQPPQWLAFAVAIFVVVVLDSCSHGFPGIKNNYGAARLGCVPSPRYINMHQSPTRSLHRWSKSRWIRHACVIWLHFLTKPLYAIGVWLGEDQRTNINKTHVEKRLDYLYWNYFNYPTLNSEHTWEDLDVCS